MRSFTFTKGLVYISIATLLLLIVLNVFPINAFNLFDFAHAVLFGISLWYVVWYFCVTKGYRVSYDRFAEGTVILMVIYNPFISFRLDLAVWLFLDIVFLWMFCLYLFEMKRLKVLIKSKSITKT